MFRQEVLSYTESLFDLRIFFSIALDILIMSLEIKENKDKQNILYCWKNILAVARFMSIYVTDLIKHLV